MADAQLFPARFFATVHFVRVWLESDVTAASRMSASERKADLAASDAERQDL
jgi:hypothetical protein